MLPEISLLRRVSLNVSGLCQKDEGLDNFETRFGIVVLFNEVQLRIIDIRNTKYYKCTYRGSSSNPLHAQIVRNNNFDWIKLWKLFNRNEISYLSLIGLKFVEYGDKDYDSLQKQKICNLYRCNKGLSWAKNHTSRDALEESSL